MAKEKIIKNSTCRYFIKGGIWVNNEGTLAAEQMFEKGKVKILPIQQGLKGLFIEKTDGTTIAIDEAVVSCFCPPKPQDGREYYVMHKDSHIDNCIYKNLKWEAVKTRPASWAIRLGLAQSE